MASKRLLMIPQEERSGGNPLFLEQLLHADEGGEGLPGTVQNVVLARMDKLEAEDRQALRAASVFGQRFAIDALRRLSGLPDYDCRPLVAQGLVRPSGEEFLFSHALVREGAYSSLPGSERRELHRRAAEWFADRDPVLTAEHLDRAEDEAAAAAYLAAAKGQARLYRYEHALRLAERGMEIASEAVDRFALACCRGELLLDLGEVARAGAAYEEALALADDDAARCRARLGLASVKRMTDDLDGALADVEMAEAIAERLDMPEEAAKAHFLHGNLLFTRGDLEGCLREHQRSLELARRVGSPELEAAALGGLGDAEYMRGRMLSAKERFQRCVELADKHGFGRISVANRPMLANMFWYAGDVEAMLHEALIAVDEAARVGHQRAELIAYMNVSVALHYRLEIDGAIEQMDAALQLSRKINSSRFEAESIAHRAPSLRLAGRHIEALADLEKAVIYFRRMGTAYFGPWALGFLAATTEDEETRHNALAEGEALLAGSTVCHNHLNFRKEAIDACLAAGDWDEALRHAAALEDFARDQPFAWTTFFVARGRALAAHGQGRRDAELVAELERLREEGKRYGFLVALPPIEAALEAMTLS
jgi:tetratricopeptide (TPR) repeat protein